jgi:hypothetical protein
MVGQQQNNPAINKTFKLQIKIPLQNAPRDVDKIESTSGSNKERKKQASTCV